MKKKKRILLFQENKIIEEFTSRMRAFASSVEDLRSIQNFESWDGLYEILPMVQYTETKGWVVNIAFVKRGEGLGFSVELRDELDQHKSNDGIQ